MHNWLIFQYRHVDVQPNIGGPEADFESILASWWRVAEGGRRKVGDPGRWLSRGKRVDGLR